MDDEVQLLNTAEAASHLRTPIETLKDWRKRGVGPSYVKLGRRVLYRRADLDAFIEVNVRPTAGVANG